ncbi:unnamed protein product [Chondrus crispus]|uniref:Uncharacterized protein n=1 Tax=Chondrus crispus TaxID=2769 RepID=R7QKY9_CHOCR|nr:unnamed protein product [Chondrus crispus]CDF38045.1 unnamed protein product [Chondrus crispus]|eukprot:XP_005717914.1 unnamed protein product [Chondrus crispus]
MAVIFIATTQNYFNKSRTLTSYATLLTMYLPTMLPSNLSVTSSTSGAMFCGGTVGSSKLASPGSVNSLPLSVPASYATRKPAALGTNAPLRVLNRLRLLICTNQSGEGATIASAVRNGFAQLTDTRSVVALPGSVIPSAATTERVPLPRSARAAASRPALLPVSAIASTSGDAKPRTVSSDTRLECVTAVSGANTSPEAGMREPNTAGDSRLMNVTS